MSFTHENTVVVFIVFSLLTACLQTGKAQYVVAILIFLDFVSHPQVKIKWSGLYRCNPQKFLWFRTLWKVLENKTQPWDALEFQQRGTPGFRTTGISGFGHHHICSFHICNKLLWDWWKMIIILLRWLTSKLQTLSKLASLSPLLPRSFAKKSVRLRDVDCSKWGRKNTWGAFWKKSSFSRTVPWRSTIASWKLVQRGKAWTSAWMVPLAANLERENWFMENCWKGEDIDGCMCGLLFKMIGLPRKTGSGISY